MKPKFHHLSQRMSISGHEVSPREVLDTILYGVMQQLGPTAVGHAKAVAHVEGGVVHASTTGIPPVVEMKVVGCPTPVVDRLDVDVLCVFHGITQKTLVMAWEAALAALSQAGLQIALATAPQPRGNMPRARSWARTHIITSLLPSFLVLKPCCLVPLLWSLFGGTVGVLHIFAPLEPYRPVFMLVALGLLGSAFYQLYLRPPLFASGENGGSVVASRILFWLASGLFVMAVLFPLLLPHGF